MQTPAIYDAIKSKFGKVPNLFKGMANSPAALKAYLELNRLITEGSFSPVEQDIVRITVSQFNGCTYCLAAHTAGLLSKKMGNEEVLQIRRGSPMDPKHAALVAFTLKVIEKKVL